MKVFAPLQWITWIAYLACTPGFAQTPSAGSIQQNIDNTVHQLPGPSKEVSKLIPAPDVHPIGGISFKLSKIDYSGNTFLTNDQIDLVIAPFLHKSIDFTQLQVLATYIEDAYRRLGFLARVVIPEQTIRNDLLIIRIEESNWGKVRIEGLSKRVDSQQISKTIISSQKTGQPLNIKTLERGLLLADDLPGVTVSGVLSQSNTALTTDLIAHIKDDPLYTVSIQTDNSGPKSIGTNRLVGNLGINSPLGIGDLFTGVFLWSEGSNYSRLGYTLPIGHDGLRVGVNTSVMSYKLVSSEFEGLRASGSSTSNGLEALYSLIRSRLTNLYTVLNTDYRVFSNSNASSGLMSQYSVMDYSASLFLSILDEVGWVSSNSLSLVFINGYTNLDGSPNQNAVATSNNAQGSFTKIRYSANRTQFLDRNGLSLYASLSGQATGANLDPSEMFYLGGMNGVRAYPSNEGAGSQGQLISFELRHLMTENVNLVLFYDYGHVLVNPNNAYAVAGDLSGYSQKGTGLSVGVKPYSNTDLKAIWAKRLGTDPNLSSSGTYQNGSSGSTQIWFIASIGF